MEKETIDQIKNKSYFELSEKDKVEMKELFTTESEFNEMKAMLKRMDGLSVQAFQPNPKVKKGLDELFAHEFPASVHSQSSFLALIVPKNKPFYRQPLVQIAALLLLLLLVVPMFNSPLVEETIQVAEVKKMENNENIQDEKTISPLEEEIKEEVKSVEFVENNIQELEEVESDVIGMEDDAVTRINFLGGAEQNDQFEVALEDTPQVFNHPDGIYNGQSNKADFISISANESEDLLDLLATSF